MDRSEEDMKFVGFFGIFKQSFKTIFSWKKIFAQITLTLILPLTLVFLAHIEISRRVFRQIESNLLLTDSDSYYQTRGSIYYWLFKLAYFTLLIVFSLLATAAVVFTIASIYTGREVVFRKVMKVVPKVWKRLFVTFVFIYVAFIIYNVLGGVALVVDISIFGDSDLAEIVWLIILILYATGFSYLSVIWQLASVVTVLENTYGFKAMRKGHDLANGKTKVGMGIAFVLYGFLVGLFIFYEWFVEFGGAIYHLAMIWRVMIGVVCGFLFLILFLLLTVTQTVLYLVCKSYHREVIDKLSLSTFLGAYVGETVVYPTAGEEIQLGRPQHDQV